MTEARGDRGEPAAFSSSRKACRRCGAGLIDVCCYVRCFVKTYVTPTKFFSGPSSDATAISDFCGGCGGRGCPLQKFRERRFYIPYIYIYMSIFIGSIDKYMLYIYICTPPYLYTIYLYLCLGAFGLGHVDSLSSSSPHRSSDFVRIYIYIYSIYIYVYPSICIPLSLSHIYIYVGGKLWVKGFGPSDAALPKTWWV